jgi:hypothetical protein
MDNGSSREVRKKIREWKNTKARQHRQAMANAAPDPSQPF